MTIFVFHVYMRHRQKSPDDDGHILLFYYPSSVTPAPFRSDRSRPTVTKTCKRIPPKAPDRSITHSSSAVITAWIILLSTPNLNCMIMLNGEEPQKTEKNQVKNAVNEALSHLPLPKTGSSNTETTTRTVVLMVTGTHFTY